MTNAPNTRKDPAPMDRYLADLDDLAYRAARLLEGMSEVLRIPEADDAPDTHE